MRKIFIITIFLSTILLNVACKKDKTKVLIETSMGNIKVELYDNKSPETVKNFLNYADSNFYEGTIFHRVIPDFMIQGGGFDAEMNQKQTNAPIKNESNNGLLNERGTIAMARTNMPHSATSQFYINTKNNNFLDYKDGKFGYCVFGKVLEGMEIVDKISSVETSQFNNFRDVPVEIIKINSIKRIPKK